jgi:hypothetical protein
MRLRRTRVIGATRLGIASELILLGCLVVGPLALLERGFGLDSPPQTQVLILALAIPVCLLGVRTVRARLPRGERLEVEVSTKELVLRRKGQPPDVVRRGDVGLVVLYGDQVQGVSQIRIHDHLSGDIGSWDTAWLGRRPQRVKRILAGFGYPCAIASELYDGRFLSQAPGQPPLGQRPATTEERDRGRG